MGNNMGISDIPLRPGEKDCLGIKQYVDGLEQFIRRCPTPMSIAIQGDWGTGKTSMIEVLKTQLEKKRTEFPAPLKCVYFNTWQYSQFRMDGDLFTSFVDRLLRCISDPKKYQEFMEGVIKACFQAAEGAAKKVTGISIKELVQLHEEKINNVERLKEGFQKIVNAATKDDPDAKLVIFIDDLDRLNPQVAVELLEVIKLFMDVERCVFVLAIDYEVVVSGVREKYGANVSEEKCRSFFDKIIQLPFRMPVETYRFDELVKTIVAEDVTEKDTECLARLMRECLSPNPRTYKRLANIFFLTRSVNESQGVTKGEELKLDNALILGILCIQMCAPKCYQLMVTRPIEEEENDLLGFLNCKKSEDLEDYIEPHVWDGLGDKEKRTICLTLDTFQRFLSSLQENWKEKKKAKDFYKRLVEIMQMTTVTNSEEVKRAAAVKVNYILINDKKYPVNNPTDALFTTFKTLLGDEPPALVREFCGPKSRILTADPMMKEADFRAKKEVYSRDGCTMYLATSSSSLTKMKSTVKLCRFLETKGKDYRIIWRYKDYDKEETVFDSASTEW